MTINPQTFAGLRSDMYPLYKALQLFIQQNGGRLKLADALEAEAVKCSRYKPIVPTNKKNRAYSEKEDWYIIRHFSRKSLKDISKHLGRPHDNIRKHVSHLKKKGLLPTGYKQRVK